MIRTDVRSLLPLVAVPTLVIHRQGELIPAEQGRYLAEHIPGAEYAELDGADHLPWVGDTGAVVTSVERFARRFGTQRREAADVADAGRILIMGGGIAGLSLAIALSNDADACGQNAPIGS